MPNTITIAKIDIDQAYEQSETMLKGYLQRHVGKSLSKEAANAQIYALRQGRDFLLHCQRIGLPSEAVIDWLGAELKAIQEDTFTAAPAA